MVTIEQQLNIQHLLYGLEPSGEHLDEGAFVCVYGSHACNEEQEGSDIDLLFAVPDEAKPEVDLDRLVVNVNEMHAQFGAEVDDEVPAHRKLLYSFSDLSRVSRLEHFGDSFGSFLIPPIVKDPEFLGSEQVRHRLALNALTTPHSVFFMQEHEAAIAKRLAEHAMTLTGSIISFRRVENFGIDSVIRALTIAEDGSEGELYLGYKLERPRVKSFMSNFVASGIADLEKTGVLRQNGRSLTFSLQNLGNVQEYMTQFATELQLVEGEDYGR